MLVLFTILLKIKNDTHDLLKYILVTTLYIKAYHTDYTMDPNSVTPQQKNNSTTSVRPIKKRSSRNNYISSQAKEAVRVNLDKLLESN